MAVLITGAKGFVGSRLVSFLKESGFDLADFAVDITDRQAVLSWSSDKKIEAVIHLAAIMGGRNKSLFKKINIDGTGNIIELCKKIRAGRLIFMSSLRALSSAKDDSYVNSKKEAEKLVINSGLPYAVLRPSMIYGPGDKKNIGFFLKIARTLPLVPVFNFRLQPLFVDDVARVIMACFKAAPNQIINLAGRETVSYADLLELLKVKGYKIRRLNAPRLFNFLLKVFSCLPFSPLPYWQIKTLLADEIFAGSQWPGKFSVKRTSLEEGMAKVI